jgi:adenylate cyclase
MAGFPDRARTLAQEALDQASALGHPHNLAFALGFTAWLAQFCGDIDLVAERAAEELTLCQEHAIPYWHSWGVMLDGWVRTRRGQKTAGLARMTDGLAAYRATGAEVGVVHFLVTLAETHLEAGDREAGLRLVDEALALSRRNGNRYFEPEAWRVRGLILLELSGPGPPGPAGRMRRRGGKNSAVACLRHAGELARGRGARAFELRAATALARLWQATGRAGAARRLLAPLDRWFREGADTPDLRTARAVLAEVSGGSPGAARGAARARTPARDG